MFTNQLKAAATLSLLSLTAAGLTTAQVYAQVGTAPVQAAGNSAALIGSVQRVPGFATASALKFSGQPGDYAELQNVSIDTTKSFTAMAWVKLNRLGGYQTVLSIDGANVSGFFLQLREDTGAFGFTKISADGPGAGDFASAEENPDPGSWYHVAGVYDADKQTMSLYINGKLQSSVASPTAWKASGPVIVGRGKFGGRPVDFLNGTVDDIRVQQSALTQAQINEAASRMLANPEVGGQGSSAAQPATLAIKVDKPTVRVSPRLYGLMTEEINYSYDGGLYGELVRNRSFQDDARSPAHWSLLQSSQGGASMQLDRSNPVSNALPVSLKVTADRVAAGNHIEIMNDGYWGIPIKPHTGYTLSFYAKGSDGFSGPVSAHLENAVDGHIFASATAQSISSEWHKYTLRLGTGGVQPEQNGRLVLSWDHSGSVNFNLVSLFPRTFRAQRGGFRTDLMDKMRAMKPAFLRLPGGNYLEGNTLADYFPWKTTLHGLEQRPGHNGPWGYRSTDGMGLMEFLRWCDDCNMEPVLAVYAGYALNGTHITPGADLAPYVDSAVDEIEYLIGDTHTKWGAQRALDGHPQPFSLHYVEIGNEDWFDRSGSYEERYPQFYKAIKAKYPNLTLIATTGVKSMVPDMIDEHYYLSPGQFVNRAHQYDTYSRTGPKIFVGEWASQEGRPTPDLNSAIGDAAWMTGMERNSDIVEIESYAPMFVNVNPGGSQWGTNLIGYNNLNSYGSPAYYAQVMFSNHHGDQVIATATTGSAKLAYSVTKDSKSGVVTIKAVNPQHIPQPLSVSLSGVEQVDPNASTITLSSKSGRDTNSISDPEHVVPVAANFSHAGKTFTYTLPANSVVVVELKTK